MNDSPTLDSKPSPAEFSALLDAARASARAANHRRLIVLAGGRDWTRRRAGQALALAGAPASLWLGDASIAGCPLLPMAKARAVLGSELDLLVFDAYAGFDPDAFGAAIGALRGGGLMLLLTPPLDRWACYADPQRLRIARPPHGPEAVGGRFLARLARILSEDAATLLLQEGVAAPPLPVVPSEPATEAPGGIDQQAAVLALLRVAEGRGRRPLVLLADRGRGKSASLGLAAARLMREGRRTILITGPRLDSVEAAFRHAAESLAGGRRSRGELRRGEASLRFVAPDELAAAAIAADLVLVDEAAAIPTPLLERLLDRYPRIAFASTVHGYEGTGRGFLLRFARALDSRRPGWRLSWLRAPMRWAADDPLERLGFRALLLDADAAADDAVGAASLADVRLQWMDRDALAADEQTLRELFGLLLLAHYRTRPFDLRQMLDAPDLELWLLRFGTHVVGAALVAAEGALPGSLAPPVCRGERRLRGHLLPQSLAAHLGLAAAMRLRCARVMRIAVHPACRRRGFGAALVAAVVERSRRLGFDLIGASFGATAELTAFWAGQDMLPVRAGVGREAMSGEHSVLALRPLSAAGARVAAAARLHFRDNLPQQLAEPLRELEPELAAALLRGMAAAPCWRLRRAELRQLHWFGHGGRGYEDSLAALWKLACRSLADPAVALTAPQRSLLVMKLLQRKDWPATAAALGFTGRAQGLAALRALVAGLLPAAAPGGAADHD